MRCAKVILFFTAFLALPAAALQQRCLEDPPCPKDDTCPEPKQAPGVCKSFEGRLAFETTAGLVQGCVVVQQWHIANEQRLEIPHQGFLIVHLGAGRLVTDIGGERREWNGNSFWSVEARQSLIVYTDRDSVVLQTVDFLRDEVAGCGGSS